MKIGYLADFGPTRRLLEVADDLAINGSGRYLGRVIESVQRAAEQKSTKSNPLVRVPDKDVTIFNPKAPKITKETTPEMKVFADIMAERALPRANMPKLRDPLWQCEPRHLGNGVYFISEQDIYTNYYEMDSLIRIMKKAGIKRSIDIRGAGKSFEQDGIEFSRINMEGHMSFDSFLMEPPFIDSDWYLRRRTIKYNMKPREAKKFIRENKASYAESYARETREYIDSFIEFIHNMQKGNCLIRGYHEEDFKAMLALNNLFNPMAEKSTYRYSRPMRNYEIEAYRQLEKNLTKADKDKLGWTEKFEKRFHRLLNRAEKNNQAYYEKYAKKYN